MLKYIYFPLIILVYLFPGCREKEQEDLSKTFDDIIKPTGERILEEVVGLFSVDIIDTMLLVYVRDSKDGQLYFYGKQSHQLLGIVGPKGRGPGEFMLPAYNGQYYIDQEGVKIWMMDLLLDKLTLIQINSESLSTGNIELTSIRLDAENVFYLNDSTIIGTKATQSGRSFVYDPGKKDSMNFVTPLFPELPFMKELIKYPYDIYLAYFEYCRIKPDWTKYACAMTEFNRIDIFDQKSDLQATVDNDLIEEIKSLDQIKENDVYSYYQDVSATETYIFAVNLKQHFFEFGKVGKPVEVEIYDWEGTPKFLIQLDEYIQQIAIDEEEQVLYGLDYHFDQMWKYDISEVFLNR